MNDEDEEIQSRTPSPAASSPISVRISVPVAPPPASPPPRPPSSSPPPSTPPPPPAPESLTLALPAQHPRASNGSGGGGSVGREDCWSETATEVLIEAWGDRYLESSRGNLKQQHWQEVADLVNTRGGYSKVPKTDVQCKNRIDTVKKKYKMEKAKIGVSGGVSCWPLFDKLDGLIGPTGKSPLPSVVKAVVGATTGFLGKKKKSKRKRKVESDDDEEEDDDEDVVFDSDDGLLPPRKSLPVVIREDVGNVEKKGRDRSAVRVLTEAMLRFGEAYERAETAKLAHVVEMEKARMRFAKEVELQRMQFFMKTQMEISQLKKRSSRGVTASKHKQPQPQPQQRRYHFHHHHRERLDAHADARNSSCNMVPGGVKLIIC